MNFCKCTPALTWFILWCVKKEWARTVVMMATYSISMSWVQDSRARHQYTYTYKQIELMMNQQKLGIYLYKNSNYTYFINIIWVGIYYTHLLIIIGVQMNYHIASLFHILSCKELYLILTTPQSVSFPLLTVYMIIITTSRTLYLTI